MGIFDKLAEAAKEAAAKMGETIAETVKETVDSASDGLKAKINEVAGIEEEGEPKE